MSSASIEVLKVVALLCSVAAGDKPSVDMVVNQIEASQTACHGFYAACLKGKTSLQDCMIKRDAERKAQWDAFEKRLKEQK